MDHVDRLLGLLEYVLVAASVGLMVCALVWPSRQRLALLSTGLVAMLAVTVAQPFGLTVHRSGPAPTNARAVATDKTHVYRDGPVGFPYRIYVRDEPDLAENRPRSTLRVRTWAWLPLLTNSTKISSLCGGEAPLCYYPGGAYTGSRLSVATRPGSVWVSLRQQSSPNAPCRPRCRVLTWKLSVGIASYPGLAFWAFAFGACAAQVARQRRLRRENITAS